MIILGIDTSCDDTCVSVVKIKNQKSKVKNFEILSNVISSQVKLHAKYGGVYPFLAKREHQRNLAPVFKKALKETRLLKLKIKNQKSKIDAIAVTVGPGLEPCLWQGVNFAKELAQKLKLPIIPVNHIEAHILANWLNTQINTTNRNTNLHKTLFPAVCLVVSGGHTELILMRGIGKYRLIGETRDDAAGECFDKVARILGLGYPGGPIVAKMVTKIKNQESRIKNIKLPRPMIYQKNYDFSFSGLKTAVLYEVKKLKTLNLKLKTEFCKEVQQAIIDVLIHKTLKAAKDFKVNSIILGGGVAANDELRKQFKLKIENCKLKINFLVPPKNLCTDNAAMVAMTAYYHRKEKFNLSEIKADANLKI